MCGEIRPKKLFFPPSLDRSSSVKHGLAKLFTFYFTARNRPLSKPDGPWPTGVGGPWNPKSLNLQGIFDAWVFARPRKLSQDSWLKNYIMAHIYVTLGWNDFLTEADCKLKVVNLNCEIRIKITNCLTKSFNNFEWIKLESLKVVWFVNRIRKIF